MLVALNGHESNDENVPRAVEVLTSSLDDLETPLSFSRLSQEFELATRPDATPHADEEEVALEPTLDLAGVDFLPQFDPMEVDMELEAVDQSALNLNIGVDGSQPETSQQNKGETHAHIASHTEVEVESIDEQQAMGSHRCFDADVSQSEASQGKVPIKKPCSPLLSQHRLICERCHQKENSPPSSDGSRVWVICTACPVAGHWQCLQPHQQAALSQPQQGSKRAKKQPQQFLCGACHRPGVCMVCLKEVVPAVPTRRAAKKNGILFFRCFTCKRPAHYTCAPTVPGIATFPDAAAVAGYYHNGGRWRCATCATCQYSVDKILAWRPYPPTAVESVRDASTPPSPTDFLPREYLVKFAERSYHRLQWIPHLWFCVSTGDSLKLRNFLSSDHEPDPTGERDIPPTWKTVERVLDIRLWKPATSAAGAESLIKQQALTREQGQNPGVKFTQLLLEWETVNGKFMMDCVNEVAWVFIKWKGLGYDDATWDSPLAIDGDGHAQFRLALSRFLASREVDIPFSAGAAQLQLEHRAKYADIPTTDFDLGQDDELCLMQYQIDGVDWLRKRWWTRDHCILADDMGLGKTVQMAVFLGSVLKQFGACPALVVVPNVTVCNWVTELEKWAPNLRVVTLFGNIASRKTLIVDEAQRLKNDTGLLRTTLLSLKTNHRILLTGTPMNNTVRELVSLMTFLDPHGWTGVDGHKIDRQDTIDPTDLKGMRAKLLPYFLRRRKDQVLTLPPKNETVIRVSMVPAQRTLYDQILRKNLDANGHLIEHSKTIRNMCVCLRQCIQHPSVYDETLPEDFESSGKLRMLKLLLRRLQIRGRRVLLFSQYVKVLAVIEHFLVCEGYHFLRMDGNTPVDERQRGMDQFNAPDSEIFIYILTTRSGGVGINLTTADTVIIFDPDYNPHQVGRALHVDCSIDLYDPPG
ncbi:P-loop containing nucleoside triphosphate hydrolase protein [Mycena alexandri]|uniref:P-loop containing nucleoside triphosphate hydrolase protein n=1 Tax=Mycena alexandri TaxID=1745969 RepID=A0AAD6SLF0_9AGAR|nr:P-loop containing nucleoside triphosphate hydrolase protein [Mycena alexandri]